jgi:hypothetical protein
MAVNAFAANVKLGFTPDSEGNVKPMAFKFLNSLAPNTFTMDSESDEEDINDQF